MSSGLARTRAGWLTLRLRVGEIETAVQAIDVFDPLEDLLRFSHIVARSGSTHLHIDEEEMVWRLGGGMWLHGSRARRQAHVLGSIQIRPSTRPKCLSKDTRSAPVSMACAAIQMSFVGIGVPERRN